MLLQTAQFPYSSAADSISIVRGMFPQVDRVWLCFQALLFVRMHYRVAPVVLRARIDHMKALRPLILQGCVHGLLRAFSCSTLVTFHRVRQPLYFCSSSLPFLLLQTRRKETEQRQLLI